MIDARKAARGQLRKDVALMRRLGVARWTRPISFVDDEGVQRYGIEDVFLGPPPAPPAPERTPEQERAFREREEQRKQETLFAATSIRPVTPESVASERAAVLKSVVPRRETQEHDNGPPKPQRK